MEAGAQRPINTPLERPEMGQRHHQRIVRSAVSRPPRHVDQEEGRRHVEDGEDQEEGVHEEDDNRRGEGLALRSP